MKKLFVVSIVFVVGCHYIGPSSKLEAKPDKYLEALKKDVITKTEEVKNEAIKKMEEVKQDISERDIKVDVSEKGIAVTLEKKPAPVIETPKPIDAVKPEVIIKPVVKKAVIKPIPVKVKTSADIKPAEIVKPVEQSKSNIKTITILIIVILVLVGAALLLTKWKNKYTVLLLIIAGSMFSGCVSIKARVLAEKSEVPRYQLDMEYTIFKIGK